MCPWWPQRSGYQPTLFAVDLAVQVGPLSRALADQPEPVRQEALNAVRQAFARKVAPEGVVIDGAAWIVTAQRG